MNLPVSVLSVYSLFKSFVDTENAFVIDRTGVTNSMSYTFIELQPGYPAEMQNGDLYSKRANI